MNTFSWILLATTGVACITGYLLLLVQNLKQHRKIDALQAQLDVFVESSIGVGRAVDRLLHQGGSNEVANVASRRWVIQEAKDRLRQGESLADVAAPLGLSKDEMRLLNAQLH